MSIMQQCSGFDFNSWMNESKAIHSAHRTLHPLFLNLTKPYPASYSTMFHYIRKFVRNVCRNGDKSEHELEGNSESQFQSCVSAFPKISSNKVFRMPDLQVQLSMKTTSSENFVSALKETNAIQKLGQLQVKIPEPEKIPTPRFEFKMFGKVLREKFQISDSKYLAGGNYGAVFACNPLDEKNGKKCALKVMKSEFMSPKDARKTWQEGASREVTALRKLQHENIMEYHDFMFLRYPPKPVGACYIAIKTELLDCTLTQVLKARNELYVPQVEQLLKSLGGALVWMVSQGYVHNDIKPDNIMFKNLDLNAKNFSAKFKEAIPKITDFGFARRYKGPRDEAIEKHFCAGSPLYMSPEKKAFFFGWTREPYYPFKSDSFALGATLVECMSQHDEEPEFSFDDINVDKIRIVHVLRVLNNPSDCLNAIEMLLQPNVEDRWHVEEALDSLS